MSTSIDIRARTPYQTTDEQVRLVQLLEHAPDHVKEEPVWIAEMTLWLSLRQGLISRNKHRTTNTLLSTSPRRKCAFYLAVASIRAAPAEVSVPAIASLRERESATQDDGVADELARAVFADIREEVELIASVNLRVASIVDNDRTPRESRKAESITFADDHRHNADLVIDVLHSTKSQTVTEARINQIPFRREGACHSTSTSASPSFSADHAAYIFVYKVRQRESMLKYRQMIVDGKEEDAWEMLNLEMEETCWDELLIEARLADGGGGSVLEEIVWKLKPEDAGTMEEQGLRLPFRGRRPRSFFPCLVL